MKLKTNPEYIGLCRSCRHASVAIAVNGDCLVRCDWFDWKIREPIVVCSKHDDKRLPSIHEMRRTAWILRTDEDKKAIGFVSNQKWRKSKEYRDNPIWDGDDD